MLDIFAQDVKYATRSLRRTPGFLAAAIATLALGIGANTAIFSLINAVLFRTLPLQAPEEVYYVAHGVGDTQIGTMSNFPWLERVRTHDEVFAGVTAYNNRDFKVTSDQGAQRVYGQYASGNYHAVLGAPIALGRGFTAEDDRAINNDPIAVISDTFWTQRFARDPQVIGRTLVVGGRPVTIVGVTAPGFEGMAPGRPVDITLPLSMRIREEPEFLTDLDSWSAMPLVVRLKPGVDMRQAQAVIETAFREHVSQPGIGFGRTRLGPRTARLQPAANGQDRLRNDYRIPLAVLMGMVGAVLLLACVNVANLLVVRATGRTREVAVRMAVGATRRRLVRQFLTESLLLALSGGALGLLLAGWGTRFVSTLFLENQNPIAIDVQPDAIVLLFAVGLSIFTGMAFGSIPALRAPLVSLTPALKQTGTGAMPTRRASGRKALVAAQIAVSVVLVFGAALLVRTQRNVQNINGGFETENVLVFSLDARDTTFPLERLTGLCTETLARLRRQRPAVAATCSTMSPVDTAFEGRILGIPAPPPAPGANQVLANTVTPDYFDTFRIGLVRGRFFTSQDTASSTRVAIISESVAKTFFGEFDPIGQRIAFGSRPDPARTLTVVGVVRDARQALRETPPKMVYQPLDQSREPPEALTAAVRTTGDPAALASLVRQEVRTLSADVAVMWVRTMRQQIAAATTSERLLATLSTAFGMLALLLACIGLYGVISYDVASHTREIGIRLALGAERSTVLAGILRPTMMIIGIGVAVGVAGALLTSRLIETLLFGLTSRDPGALVATAVTLSVTAAAAGYLPARRASRVDPATALRAE
jgi:putative ABC transport system permease protein